MNLNIFIGKKQRYENINTKMWRDVSIMYVSMDLEWEPKSEKYEDYDCTVVFLTVFSSRQISCLDFCVKKTSNIFQVLIFLGPKLSTYKLKYLINPFILFFLAPWWVWQGSPQSTKSWYCCNAKLVDFSSEFFEP